MKCNMGYEHDHIHPDVKPGHISSINPDDPRTHGYYCSKCGYRLNYTTEKWYHCIREDCEDGKKNR